MYLFYIYLFFFTESLNTTRSHIWINLIDLKDQTRTVLHLTEFLQSNPEMIGWNHVAFFFFIFFLNTSVLSHVVGTRPAIIVRKQAAVCCETNNSQLHRCESGCKK